MEAPNKLLEELRKTAGSVKAPGYLNDADYILQYKQYKEALPSDEYPNKMKLFFEKIRLVISRNHDRLFRVCSIGCGDGLVDNDILSTMTKEYPDLHIQYVGIDLSPMYCQLAKDNLKPGKNVEVTILKLNFLDFTDGPFDFVIALHSLYYLPSPEDGIKKVLSLIKDTGMAVAALRSHDALFKPHEALCNEEKMDLCYSDVLARAMDGLGVQYDRDSYSYVMDLTTCLKNNFQSPVEKNVLDFIAHVKLEFYPETVTKTLISYLDAICYGKPEKALLDMTVECFCITK